MIAVESRIERTAPAAVTAPEPSVDGTLVGNTISGTETETYNVFVGGTSSAVGTLTVSNSFSVTRQ